MRRIIGLHHLVGLLVLVAGGNEVLSKEGRAVTRSIEALGATATFLYGEVNFYDEISGLVEVEGTWVSIGNSFGGLGLELVPGDLVLVFGEQSQIGGVVAALTIEKAGRNNSADNQSISGTGLSAQSISGTGKQSISGTGLSAQSISGTGKQSISGTGLSAQSISGTGKQSISGTGVSAQSISGTGTN
jgi:hypothetical protein